MAKTQMCYFLTVSFYDKYDQYHVYTLRGYYDKVYARAVCDRLMKYVIDRSKWMAACKTYLDTHPELLAIPMKDNQYPKTRCKLRAEWESANPLATTAKQHNRNYSITEVPIKVAAAEKVFVVMANYDEGAQPMLAFRNEAAANEEAAKRNLREEDWYKWNQMLRAKAATAESVKTLQAAFTAAKANSNDQSGLRRAYENLEAEKNKLLDIYAEETPFQSEGKNFGDAYHDVDEIPLI